MAIQKAKTSVNNDNLDNAIAAIHALPYAKNSEEWWSAVDAIADGLAMSLPVDDEDGEDEKSKPRAPKEFWRAVNVRLLGKRPAPPKSKEAGEKLVEALVRKGRKGEIWPLAVPPKTGQRGSDAAPGETVEHLVGVGGEGGNAKISDGKREFKFHGNKTLLTLLHSTPKLADRAGNFSLQMKIKDGKEHQKLIGGAAMWKEILPLYGYPRKKDGEWACQRTFGNKLHFEQRNGSIFLLPNAGVTGDYGLGWDANTLNQDLISKLKEIIIVLGKVSKKNNTVRFMGAIKASVLREPVLDLITATQTIIVEPDVHFREKQSKGPRGSARGKGPRGPRDRGTKFRIHMRDLHKLWITVSDLEFDDVGRAKWVRRAPLSPSGVSPTSATAIPSSVSKSPQHVISAPLHPSAPSVPRRVH